MPSLSTQSIARLITSKLSPVSCFRDWESAWAVYASVVSKVAPGNLPDLISYMLVITEAAKRSDFDWQKYDRLFCQGVALDTNKRWGVADPSIWVHCLGKHQPVPVSFSSSNPNSGQNPAANFNFAMLIITVNAIMASTADFFTVA